MNFYSFCLLTEVKTLVRRVVTLFRFTAGFWRSRWANVRLSFGPFGIKLWILWLKPTQQKLEITFLAVKTCYKQWWVILSCKTFLLVWQPSASRLICINFPHSIALTACKARYSEANNKYMKVYNPNKPSKYIQYLDVNNLYGGQRAEVFQPTVLNGWKI